MNKPNTNENLFFNWVTSKPKTFLFSGLILIVISCSFFLKLTTDPRAEAFLPPDSPALLYRDKVEQVFGLTDPMVIAVESQHKNGVFNPSTLALVKWLTDEVNQYKEVNSERIVSLATEDNIFGTTEGMLVEPFFQPFPQEQKQAEFMKKQVMDFPLYVGSLVSADSRMTLVVLEMFDEKDSPAVYEKLLELVDRAPLPEKDKLYVAGDGAVSGYLATYMNADAARLVPISIIIITLLCVLSFRTLQGVILPGLVILAATSSAIGVMAAFGDPVYVITTSMPILLVGIAVADSIHILSEYYQQKAAHPTSSQRTLVVNALTRMWRPVLLTTMTSMIGFLGVYASSYMPPMQSFGLYSMLGLAVAGIFSLLVVPATQMLFKAKSSPAFPSDVQKKTRLDLFGRMMVTVGSYVLKYPKSVLLSGFIVTVMGLMGASNLEANESWVDNFRSSEKIHIANTVINEAMNGTSNLDIVIETSSNEGLFTTQNLEKIELLQTYLEEFEVVGGTTSIVDYLKQMNRALNENEPNAYVLPSDPALIPQYFLLYSASGDPTAFEEEVDYEYRRALLRAQLKSGRFQDFKPVVEQVQEYLVSEFNDEQITASLSGRVYVDYEWLDNLLGTHFKGVFIALSLVWIVACLSFRSLYGGTLTIVPVLLSTLAVYALMGLTGITLAVGTTMTAAIALGIGIDFSIHTIERIRYLVKQQGMAAEQALIDLYPSTGRALLFNFLAVFIGFGVLALSYVPPLAKLGVLISFAVSASFISSMTVLPALIKVLEPKFLGFSHSKNRVSPANNSNIIVK